MLQGRAHHAVLADIGGDIKSAASFTCCGRCPWPPGAAETKHRDVVVAVTNATASSLRSPKYSSYLRHSLPLSLPLGDDVAEERIPASVGSQSGRISLEQSDSAPVLFRAEGHQLYYLLAVGFGYGPYRSGGEIQQPACRSYFRNLACDEDARRRPEPLKS